MAHMQITKVADIFSPIFHLLALKESDEKAAAEAAGKFQAWLSKRASPADEEDMEEGDALEVDFEEKLGVHYPARTRQQCEELLMTVTNGSMEQQEGSEYTTSAKQEARSTNASPSHSRINGTAFINSHMPLGSAGTARFVAPDTRQNSESFARC